MSVELASQWDQEEVAEYLLANYYPKYCPGNTPSKALLVQALDFMGKRVMVGMREGRVCGVSIYLTLDDETFEDIEDIEISRVDVLAQLMQQQGGNIHFILVVADSLKTLRKGVRCVKALKPKTVSWWNPGMDKVHRYNLGG